MVDGKPEEVFSYDIYDRDRAYEKDKADLRKDKEDLRSERNQYKQRMSSLEDEIKNLREEIGELKTNLSSYESNVKLTPPQSNIPIEINLENLINTQPRALVLEYLISKKEDGEHIKAIAIYSEFKEGSLYNFIRDELCERGLVERIPKKKGYYRILEDKLKDSELVQKIRKLIKKQLG